MDLKMVPDFELNDEQRQFRRHVKEFVDEEIRPLDLQDYEWRDDPRDRIPWDVIDTGAKEYGLMDVTVPEEFGGMDLDPLSLVLGVEELAVGDMGIGHIFTYNWKKSKIVDVLADDELREEFYEEFVDDPRHLVCTAQTEPYHGSDNLLNYPDYQLDTTAEKDGDEWVINGKKRFISNGADANTYLIHAQTDANAPAIDGTTLFMVPSHYDGLEVTHVHEKISQRLINNATIEFDDLRVPERRILGEVNRGISGSEEATDALNLSPIEAPATTLGSARRAFEDALEYANERVQGGTEIINHQSIAHDFAGMYTDLHAARQLVWMVARSIEREQFTTEYGAMANLFASKVAYDVATRSLEKFGGQGIMLETPAQKYVRDTLSYLHSSGTQDVLKQQIAEEVF